MKKKHNPFFKLLKLSVLLVTYIFSTGCLVTSPLQENSEDRGESILKNITCLPPCWEGVIPGETSKQELMTILYSIEKNNDSIIDHDEGLGNWDDIVSIYLYSQYGQKINFFIVEDMVVEISFSHKLYITLNEVIEILGEPDWIYPGLGHNGSILIIIYEKEAVALLHQMESGLFVERDLVPQSEIVEMSFFNSIEAIEKNVVTRDDLEKYGYRWAGYGDVDKKYPVLP
ncbi:MAG: hypothetical protein IPG80_08175 [Anaerolineales bacterium]|uniref:hypothetical protein n=1 Tax=Candidatus Villigracilis vicinus TaxID=3140679 RepID=UPI003135C201|nr:hypothetical protein [Anaerolineales bacterium]